MFSPLTTLAGGTGDVLDWMSIQFFVLIAFLIMLLLIKINWVGKGIMIFIFIATEYLTMKLSVGLPYSTYKLMITIISIVAPIVTTFISYLILKKKFVNKI